MKPPDKQRCDCGYVYSTPRPAGFITGDDPNRHVEGLPIYVPSGWTSLFLLMFMAGTNGAGAALVVMAGMVAAIVGMTLHLGPGIYVVAFGASAVIVDTIARRLSRCSALDIKRGSQFFMFPVWLLGIASLLLGFSLLLSSGW